MRVTEKGQVTIPKNIRDRLGIVPGSEVEFVEAKGGALLVRVDASASEEGIRDFDDWAAKVERTLDLGGMSTDEYMEWLRGPRDDIDPR